MKDEKNKTGKNNNIKDTLRNMAGIYLLYIAYKMISDIVKGVNTTIKPALGISIAVVFAAFGIYIIIDSYKKMKRDKQKQIDEAKAEAKAAAEAKEAEQSGNLLEAEGNNADKGTENDAGMGNADGGIAEDEEYPGDIENSDTDLNSDEEGKD